MALLLRYYQEDSLTNVMADKARGINRVIVALPTGTGKSAVQNNLVKRYYPIRKYRTMFVGGLNRALNHQGMAGFKREYEDCRYPVQASNGRPSGFITRPGIGIVMGNESAPDARIVVASAQTITPSYLKDKTAIENQKIQPEDVVLRDGGIFLAKGSKRRWMISARMDEILAFGMLHLWIHDECFAAGTLIDGLPIETLRVGDLVTAFNEKTQRFEKKKVVRLFSHRPKGDVVRVVAGNTAIICTANHPIYTQRGWIVAGELNAQTDKVLRSDMRQLQGSVPNQHQRAQRQDSLYEKGLSSVLLSAVCGSGAAEKLLSSKLLSLRSGSYFMQPDGSHQDHPMGTIWQNVLLHRVYTKDFERRVVYQNGRNQSQTCIRANEEKQSDAYAWDTRQDETNAPSYSMETSDSRRQWDGLHGAAADAGSSVGGWLAYGVGSGYAEAERGGLSNRLQNRHRTYRAYDCNRSGRRKSSFAKGQNDRPEENRFSEWVGVDSVTVQEQSSDGTYGGMLPDGLVYNFEVEELHTYIANGIVVHNCHHAPADGTMFIMAQLVLIYQYLGLDPIHSVGFTATPMRNDERALANCYDRISYQMTYDTAVEQGFLAPLPPEKVFYVQMMSAEGEEEMTAVTNWDEQIIKAYRDKANGRTAAAFVGPINGMGGVAASKFLSKKFNEAGITSVHVDGEYWIDEFGAVQSNNKRNILFERIMRGEIKVVCNFNVLVEGVDLPILDCLLLAKKVNEVTFTQMLGRILRLFNGDPRYGLPPKVDASVIDFTGQQLVVMQLGTMTGIKVDPFYVKPIITGVDPEADKTKTPKNSGDLRDMVLEGWVLGTGNMYHLAKIKRGSKHVWHIGKDNWMSMSIGEKNSLIITAPHYGTADMYMQMMNQENLSDDALAALGEMNQVFSNFMVWHIRDGEVVDGEAKRVSPNLDEIEMWAGQYAEDCPEFVSTLSKKNQKWRSPSVAASDKQIGYMKGLAPEIDTTGKTKSQVAEMITHELARRSIQHLFDSIEGFIRESVK